MNRSFTVFSSLFLALACPAEPSDNSPPVSPKLTLSAATQAALAHNRSLQEARARWEAMKARVPQAAAWDDLRISTTTTVGRFVEVAPNSFTDHLLTVEQMIPLSGKNQSRARIAAAEALGSLEELRRAELDVVLTVRSAFIRLGETRALLELNRGTEASLNQSLLVSRGQLEAGGQTQSDVLTAESGVIRIGELRRDLERTSSEEETRLNVLMNRDPFAPLGEPAGELPSHASLDSERLRGLILTHRPELRLAAAKVAAAAAKVELARREWVPDPTLSVGAQRYNGAAQGVSEVTAGVSFNIPWLNPRKYRAEEQEAQSTLRAAQRAAEGEKEQALGALRDQVAKIETALHHVMLYRERLLPNLRQTVETNRANYESGKSSLLDLVAAQRNLLESESMVRQHLADYQVALAELEALAGTGLQLFPAEEPAGESITTGGKWRKP